MRIGGLASGMDIDTLVKDLMKAERIPLDKLSQKKTLLEWQRDDYRAMNKLLADFDNLIFDGVMKQSTFLQKKVTSTNEAAVSATATGASSNFTSRIKVTELATARSWISGTIQDTNPSTAIAKKDEKLNTITFSNNNKNYITPFDLKFNIQKPGGSMDTTNTITVKIDPTVDTLDSIAKKISNSGLGVSAFYDGTSGKFVMTNNSTGAGAEIKVADATTSEFFTSLNYSSATAGSNLDDGRLNGAGTTNGSNAKFDLNGLTGMESISNTVSVAGVKYVLKQTTSSEVVISSSTDTDAIVDSVVKFVDQYNKTIEAINDELSESRFRGYPPLTDEQRKGLSEKEAELWDEKAKSGMLRGDSILSGGLNTIRQELYSNISTGDINYNHLSKIGITTSSNFRDKGKLKIEETELRKALETNPDAVMKMFTGDSTNNIPGIASKLRETIEKTVKKIELKAGNPSRTNAQFTIGHEIMDMDKRISNFQDRLVQVENRYWRQFQAMESAIQRSNQQAAYLMQQFGGGQ
jgi:flagellar hook-associated protein 2